MSDNVNHPSHYTSRQYECIDEMIALFGIEDTIAFCKLNAWKYRYRESLKGKYYEDTAKADWYINKAIELLQRQGKTRFDTDENS